jgi:5-formyltetrahydrofolate cyclo-ligase
MSEFQSLHDWQTIDQQLRRNLWALHNLQHKRQIERMYKNLTNTVTVLSQTDVERRRFGHSVKYEEQLVKVQQQLQELQGWLMFATLLDEKPKE